LGLFAAWGWKPNLSGFIELAEEGSGGVVFGGRRAVFFRVGIFGFAGFVDERGGAVCGEDVEEVLPVSGAERADEAGGGVGEERDCFRVVPAF